MFYKKFSEINNNKLLISIFFINFLFFNLNSTLNINKFTKIPSNTSVFPKLLGSPVEMNIWKKGYEFKNDISISNLQNYEFRHHFLPPKNLGIIGAIFNIEFYNNNNEISFKGIYKFFLFQTLIYYISVLFFYKKLIKLDIKRNVINITVFFLLFEPTINQYRYTIFGETIFFSILIFIFSFLINLPKKNISYIFFGLLVAVCYLQRSVAMFLIVVPIIIIIISKEKKIINKIINLIISFSLVLICLGYLNYKRIGLFYFLPTQTVDNLYNYFLPALENKRLNLQSINKAKIELKIKKMNYAKENNLDLGSEIDRIKFYKWQKNKAIETILENKIITAQLAMKSSLHSMLLNPTEILFNRLYGTGYYKSDLHQKTIIFRIIYSITIYLLIFLGIYHCYKKKIHAPHLLMLCGIYFFAISSWVGYTRYFVPTFLSLNLYFSFGVIYLYNKVVNYKIK